MSHPGTRLGPMADEGTWTDERERPLASGGILADPSTKSPQPMSLGNSHRPKHGPADRTPTLEEQ